MPSSNKKMLACFMSQASLIDVCLSIIGVEMHLNVLVFGYVDVRCELQKASGVRRQLVVFDIKLA